MRIHAYPKRTEKGAVIDITEKIRNGAGSLHRQATSPDMEFYIRENKALKAQVIKYRTLYADIINSLSRAVDLNERLISENIRLNAEKGKVISFKDEA